MKKIINLILPFLFLFIACEKTKVDETPSDICIDLPDVNGSVLKSLTSTLRNGNEEAKIKLEYTYLSKKVSELELSATLNGVELKRPDFPSGKWLQFDNSNANKASMVFGEDPKNIWTYFYSGEKIDSLNSNYGEPDYTPISLKINYENDVVNNTSFYVGGILVAIAKYTYEKGNNTEISFTDINSGEISSLKFKYDNMKNMFESTHLDFFNFYFNVWLWGEQFDIPSIIPSLNRNNITEMIFKNASNEQYSFSFTYEYLPNGYPKSISSSDDGFFEQPMKYEIEYFNCK